ncbi:MAG TPA: hypothetical protein VN039_05705 [Nitrospira sp.]|nr:hypothetical protein [Nitrospira sp.]
MGINIRQKGAEGEREVARSLNSIINAVLKARSIPVPEKDVVQRNQNQSAVGGGDLSNVFGLSVEVKRQEQLAVNTWWAQCEASANRNGEIPVLVYRVNRSKWRVVMYAELVLFSATGTQRSMKVRCEVEWEPFLQWFYHWVDAKISAGETIRS